MRKLLLFLLFIIVSITANAQLFLSGGITLTDIDTRISNSSVKLQHSRNTSFTIAPAVGYMFPGTRCGVGVVTAYGRANSEEAVGKAFTNAYDVSLFFRYVYALFPKITLYADLKFPIGYSNTKAKVGTTVQTINDVSKTSLMGVRLVPGLSYKFTDHILFTTEIGLMSANFVHTKKTTFNDGVVTENNDFTLGANNRAIASFCFVYLF